MRWASTNAVKRRPHSSPKIYQRVGLEGRLAAATAEGSQLAPAVCCRVRPLHRQQRVVGQSMLPKSQPATARPSSEHLYDRQSDSGSASLARPRSSPGLAGLVQSQDSDNRPPLQQPSSCCSVSYPDRDRFGWRRSNLARSRPGCRRQARAASLSRRVGTRIDLPVVACQTKTKTTVIHPSARPHSRELSRCPRKRPGSAYERHKSIAADVLDPDWHVTTFDSENNLGLVSKVR
jgi:hypothetical protein